MNLPKKFNIKFFKISTIFFLLIFLINFNNYIGNKFIFFIFNLCSLSLFLVLVRKNVLAFEFFLGFLFLLSFWFKFSCILFFEKVNVTEGDFDLSISNYDNAVIAIIFSFIGFIIGIFLREKILKKILIKKKYRMNGLFLIFYTKYRFYIIFLSILTLIFFWVSNSYYKIYAKGLVNENIPMILRYLYSWVFTYALSIFVSVLVFLDFYIFKNKKYLILGYIEAFFSSLTIYSRVFILFFFAYSRGFLSIINDRKLFTSKIFNSKIILSVLFFIFLSVHITTLQRNVSFYNGVNKNTFDEILHIAVNRWVGIDALLAVSQNNETSFDLFKSSLSEEKNFRKNSFYINNFFQNFKYNENEDEKLNTVITPGIIAFLYYSGSIIFIFFSVIFIILIFSFIEKLFFYLSCNNIILSNIVGFSLAMRIAHFGYVPYNTINFILSYLFTLFIIYILSKMIWKIE